MIDGDNAAFCAAGSDAPQARRDPDDELRVKSCPASCHSSLRFAARSGVSLILRISASMPSRSIRPRTSTETGNV